MERYILRFDSTLPPHRRSNGRTVYLGGCHEDGVYDEPVRDEASRLDKRETDYERSVEYAYYNSGTYDYGWRVFVETA